MTTWHEPLAPLDQGPSGWRCLERVEQLLAGEVVEHTTAATVKDVCDDGHVHTDVTLGLLTATRLLHVVASDAQHVTEEHELGLQCSISSIPLSSISEVQVHSWDQERVPSVEVRVARPGGSWQAVGDLHDCGDPECDIPPGSIQLEARTDGAVFLATGAQAADLVAFAGALARRVGRG